MSVLSASPDGLDLLPALAGAVLTSAAAAAVQRALLLRWTIGLADYAFVGEPVSNSMHVV